MNHLRDLYVLVLGLGDSGLAMARWCARHGARVQVWDSRAQPPGAEALRADWPDAAVLCGALTDEQVTGLVAQVQLVLKSPGLAPDDARIAPLLAAARARGTAVGGELDLFARALADLKAERGYAPQVLAITGTNGKTTTTAMCALLVERCGHRVAMAGNIGPTMLDTLADALARETFPVDAPEAAATEAAAGETGLEAVADVAPDTTPDTTPEAADAADAEPAAPEAGDDEAAPLQFAPPPPAAPRFDALPEVWVLELSSFQLHGAQGFEPAAATVLNITQDHLDWHGSLAAYAADKARIFGQQAVMVVNRDDPQVEAMVPAPLVVKGGRGQRAKTIARKVVRFGLDAPKHPGDFGLVTENGMAWLVRAREVDETLKKRKGEADEILLQRLMPADALRVRGRHNAANALAALALASAIGCPLAPMLHGLREYRGEPHRVEFIATVGGVEAFDDSKGTNVGATVAALLGLGADKAPAKLVVILGGDGKGQDFAPLAEPVARFARAVALIGRDAPAIGQAIAPAVAGTGIAVAAHGSLEAAVAWCFDQAREGDAVLLSPACASLDMFRNYGHRAEVFVAAVHARADALGGLGMSLTATRLGWTGLRQRLQSLWQRGEEALPIRDYTGAPAGGAARLSNFDVALLWCVLAMLAFSLVMVYSASVALPDSPRYKNYAPTHFLLRQALYIGLGLVVALVAVQIPVATWERAAPWLMVGALLLLAVVLVVGPKINGARRWLPLGPINFQPSEFAKLAMCMYAASYMVRKMEVKERFFRAVWPMAVTLGVIGVLLLAEPDMGAFVVIALVALGILFLGGVNGRMFFLSFAVLLGAFVLMIVTNPWRLERALAFTDPFDPQWASGKGYQLSQSLIAFGRGQLTGQGLGASIEKLHYLPEAHTDFLLAVVGEELGFVGVTIVLATFFWLTRRIFMIGRQAIALDRIFAGLMTQGIGIWIGGQSLINLGVNLGALPTKGITLPMLSYGGSGILLNLVALAVVLRVDAENRALMRGGRA